MNTPPTLPIVVVTPPADGEIVCQCGATVDPTVTVRFDSRRYPALRVVGCPSCCGWFPVAGGKKPH